MRRTLLIGAGVASMLVFAAAAVVFVLTNTNWGREKVRTRVVSALNGSAHGIVKVGRISGNVLRGLTVHDVVITDSAGAPFVAVRELRAGYGLRALASRKIELRNVRLDHPVIVIDRLPDGRWNYDRIFPGDTTDTPKDKAGIRFGQWVVLHDVLIVQGHLTVRSPWSPDRSLSAAGRDSAIADALDGKSRTTVVRVAGGFQKVQLFRDVDAVIPFARIEHPNHVTRLFEVDSLRTIALAFAPPAADVRQLSGTFETNRDSVWFRNTKLTLPTSNATLAGRYTIENGDLALRVVASRVSLSDVRFLYPALPDEGQARFDLMLDWGNKTQHWVVRDLDVRTGAAFARGAVGLTVGDTVLLHQTDVTFAGVNTRLLERLVPGLEVPRTGVLSGRAKVEGSLAAMRVDGDVTFDDAHSGRSRVVAAGDVGTTNGVVHARDLHVSLAPLQVDFARIAPPTFPLHGTLTGRAVLDGSTDSRLHARQLDITHFERGQRSRVVGRGAVRLGTVPYIDLDVRTQPLSLVTVGRFAPAAGLRGAVSGPIRLNGTLRDLAVSSTLRSSDGGAISIAGRLDIVSPDVGYNLQVATVLFNAHALVEKAPATSLSAELSASGRGFDPATMESSIVASVSTSTIDTVAVDSSRIRLRIAGGLATIDTLAIRAPGAAVDVMGTFGLAKTSSGSLTYRITIDSLGKFARYLPIDTGVVFPRPARVAETLARARADWSRSAQRLAVARAAGAAPPAMPVVVDTPSAVRRDSLAGALSVQGALRGGLGGFDTMGQAIASGLVIMGNGVQRARAQYEWLGALTPSSAMSLAANADSVSAAGFALDSVETRLTYRTPGGTTQLAIYQNSARDYSLRADYAIYPDRKEMLLNSLRLRFDSTQWTSTRPGAVRWGQPGIEIDTIEIRNGATGRVFVNGRLPTAGAADLQLIVNNFQVGDILGLLQSDVPARGLLSVNTTVTGTGAAPAIRGDAAIANAMYRGSMIPDVRTTFDYANVRLTARADATYVGRAIAQVSGTVPVDLALRGVVGSRLPDTPALLDLRADSVPLDLVSRFTDVISEVQGFARGTATWRGTLRKPDLNGNFVVALGQARLNPVGVTLKRITGAIRLKGDTVVIASLSADSDGPVRLRGGIGISKIAEPSFDLRLSAANARMLDNEQGKIRADADIAMIGPFNAVEVRGQARIRQGVLYIPASDQKQMISAGDPAVFAVIDTANVNERELIPGQSPLLQNLRMNLQLAVDRDTWVRSREANIEIYSDGDLRIDVDRRRQVLTLDGVVNTDRGEYEFLSKRFQIKRGTATFIGTQELNPLLQLTGEYEVKQASRQALFVRVLIGGTLLSPRLSLESDAQPPISQSDLLSYLAFGSESGSLLQFGGSSVSGGTPGGGLVGTSAALATRQLAGVGLGVVAKEIEGEAARSLGADVFNITPASVPTELASGNFGKLEMFFKGTQFEFGKYFTTQTFVGLQAQLTVVPGFRIEHRFRRNPGLSLETTFQPRFFLPEPSLSAQDLRKANSLGVFLIRRWRF